MDRSRTIVVGVDFSESSRNALRHGLRIARQRGANLRIVHVIQPSLAGDLAEAYAVPQAERWEDLSRMTNERMRKMLSAVLETEPVPSGGSHGDIRIKIDVLFGNPFVHLLRELRDVNAELLVLGVNKRSDPEAGLGELATKCLRKAPVAVLLVASDADKPFEQILACVGFTEKCHSIIAHAIRLSRQDAAHLSILHLYPVEQRVAVTAGASAHDHNAPGIEARLTARLHEFLPPFAAEMSGMSMHIQATDLSSHKEAISRFVEQWCPDLVVVGTRGRTTIKDAIEPTTVEQIFRRRACSVLAIKPDDFEYEVGGTCRRR